MKTLLFVSGALFALSVSAQPVTTPAELRKATDQVMTQIGSGNFDGGFKLLKPRTIIPEAEFDAAVGQAKLQVSAMSQRFGASLGYEFIRDDRAGENLVRTIYIHRFERHATRWVFYGYRGKTGWVVDSFFFDDKIQAVFVP
jgi:hypothetical protein